MTSIGILEEFVKYPMPLTPVHYKLHVYSLLICKPNDGGGAYKMSDLGQLLTRHRKYRINWHFRRNLYGT